jgi:hypothetical protein
VGDEDSVTEPEPQGAASFGRSRNCNAMRLRLRQWHYTWLGIEVDKNVTVIYPFSSYFQQYNRTESNEQGSFNMSLHFSSF